MNGSGVQNVAVGNWALAYNTTGNNSAALGLNALYSNTTGGNNVAVGINSLYTNITGGNNTALGFAADVTTSALTNATAIGYNAKVDASNKVRIGDASVTVIGGQVAWSNLSDARLKEDVRDYTHGLDLITKLRPVEYKLISDGEHHIHNGFIAQEVEATGIPFYGINRPASPDGYYSLSYADFVVPLVNAVKELKSQNDQLKSIVCLDHPTVDICK